MPARSFRRIRLTTLFCALVLAIPAPAQPPSRAAEADVRLGLREAQRLADTEPDKAAEKLRQLLSRVTADGAIPAERREALARIIRDRLRVVQAGPVDPPAESARQKELRAAGEKRAEEQARVKAGLEAAAALQKAGKADEAARKLDELTRAHPTDLAVQAEARADETSKQQADHAAVKQDKERRTLAGLNSVNRAAVPSVRDVELPPDWKEKKARRQADNALTAKEIALLKALNAPIKVRFKESPLQDAVDYLSTLTDLPIVLDKPSLDELGLTYGTPVTFAIKGPVATRTALRAILSGLGLTFVVQDGVVVVTSVAKARTMMSVKVFFVGDLTIDPAYGGILGELLNAQLLMQTIMATVEPDSWEVRGGPGVIRYYPPTHSFIVRQSAEVHAMLKGSLPK
jgi:hypothetical protein